MVIQDGGAALSVKKITNRPIKFATTGEKLSDIEIFHPERMTSRILGMGDVLSIIEKAEEAFDKEEAIKLEEKLKKQSFDLDDYLKQLRQMKKMGMDMKELKNVKEVIIRLEDKELVIPNADVSMMNVMGQETYQISGKAHEVEIEQELIIPDEDIEMVANQARVSAEEAEKALIESEGDLAEAILKLSQ